MYSKLTLITIGSNIEEVPLINLSANVFVFRDFWLTYSGGTDRTGERCFTISISNDFTQMNNPPARIHDYNSHSSSSTGFFPSDPSIRSTVAFPSLENSDQVFVFVSIDFPSFKPKRRCPFLSQTSWLFSWWLGWYSWSFERCSMGECF